MSMKQLNRLIKSIRFASRGIAIAFQEQTFKILVGAAGGVVVLILLLPLRQWEVIIVLMLVTLVLVLEVLNSVFERIADMVEPRIHSYVKEIKDLMAGAVLIAAIASAVIGILIFYPYL